MFARRRSKRINLNKSVKTRVWIKLVRRGRGLGLVGELDGTELDGNWVGELDGTGWNGTGW